MISRCFLTAVEVSGDGVFTALKTTTVLTILMASTTYCVALTVYILDQPRVSSLQGLLLLMKCPAIPGIQNLYREQACAMALALGLHRDPEPWTLCQSVIQLRRNIFWCCYVIDASYSLSSGSPERFPDDYITIGLPKLPSIENGDDIGEIEAETETNRIGFLIEQAKLWRIVKKIRRCGQASNKSEDGYSDASNIYSHQGNFNEMDYTQPSGSPPPWVWRADSARRILDVELAQWQMELPDKLRFDFGLTKQDAPCPFLVRVNGLGGTPKPLLFILCSYRPYADTNIMFRFSA